MIENITNSTLNELTTAQSTTVLLPSYVGFLALIVTVIFFGSVFVPVKKFETGDGLFFQLILCMGIWFVAFVINWVRDFPIYYALPMLGGFLWTTANMITVPVIKCIGLALGLLISGTTSLVVGWAYARFGWFGIKAQVPSSVWMNYVGVVLALMSTFFYIFVKPDVRKIETEKPKDVELTEKMTEISGVESQEQPQQQQELEKQTKKPSDIFDCLNTPTKRILGVLMSMYGGGSFAFSYTPILYIIDNYENSSKNGLDYVFSYYSGIMVTSFVYFLIYSVIKKNKPLVFPNIIIPAFVSGCMWGIGNFCFLIASTTLTQAVVFPSASAGPPMVGILYSIFVFKEIKGKRNYIILSAGFIVLLAGSIFSGLSK